MRDIPNEERLLTVCMYSHDGDFSVYEEKSCQCTLFRRNGSYFIRRSFSECWDYKEISAYSEDIPVDPADLALSEKRFSAKYCHGYDDNPWISTYGIHKDAEKDTGPSIREILESRK